MGYAGWVLMGVLVSAAGGALVWFEKPLLQHYHPLNLNLLIRVITFVVLSVTVVPMSVFGIWSLAISTPASAAGYIALAAFFEWAIALSAFYYALRISSISVVMPIVAASPLITALLAAVFLGDSLGVYTIVGLAVTVAGVVILTRWMPPEEEESVPQQMGDAVVAARDGTVGPTDGQTVKVAGALGTTTRTTELTARRTLLVITPAILATVAWGAYPIFIEAAERIADGPTVGMMLISQILGAAFLVPFLAARRRLSRGWRPPRHALRRVIWFFVALGLLELTWGVFFFFLVEELGPVLTSILITMAPVFGVLGGVVIWKERLDPPAWIGAGLSLVGVFIATLGGSA